MENQLTIRCLCCGQVTLTTDAALRIRCTRCLKEIFVQWGPHLSLARPLPESSRDQTFYPGNQRPKCIPLFKEGSSSSTSSRRNRVRDVPGPFVGAARTRPVGANKRALICGVSYKNQKHKLRGTLNDAHEMRDFLVKQWGFSNANIVMLTEEAGGRVPTKKNMEEGMKWLVGGCRAGDSLVFYFSGHGINQREMYPGDEADGLDESLCPVDFSTEGVIRDNDLNSVLVRPLPPHVTLHAIVDACHSGTILDLPWVFTTKTDEWVDNRPRSGANKGTSGGLAISFSACRDDQMAADTSAFTGRGMMNGALTMSFIQALSSNNSAPLSYHQLLLTMQGAIAKSRGSRFRVMLDKFLRRYFVQDPLLSSSHDFPIREKMFQV